MAVADWLNENMGRSFPFLTGTVNRPDQPLHVEGLGNAVIVDAGFMVGLESGFVNGQHRIYLAAVYRIGSTLHFDFRSDAPGLWNRVLSFTRQVGDPRYTSQYLDNDNTPFGESAGASDSLFSDSLACAPEPLWSGYLITGNLQALSMSDGEVLVAASQGCVLEPALIQNLANTYVSSINVANIDRTRVDSPDGCIPPAFDFPIGPDLTYVNAKCLRGHIRLVAGYNATVRQDNSTNTLILGGDVGAGAGEPCEEVPLFAREKPPDGSLVLEGGPRCNEVVRTLNGVGGQYATILGGVGVRVEPDPNNFRIVINVDMHSLTVCFASAVSESLPASLSL